jgi:sugar/nucleoside kinase (ribokinase family)
LYLITNDPDGEREFHYWREHSPARELFDSPITPVDCGLFYFTGITLAVTRSGEDKLQGLLGKLRERHTQIVFDPNCRPRLWESKDQARDYYRQALPYCDTVLPTLEDETALWGTANAEDCGRRYHRCRGFIQRRVPSGETARRLTRGRTRRGTATGGKGGTTSYRPAATPQKLMEKNNGHEELVNSSNSATTSVWKCTVPAGGVCGLPHVQF